MAEPSNPRRTKLDWFKAIRGADLTSAEVHLLALLVGYSNAQGENAHPGITRLANDSGVSERQVRRILRSLEAKSAIAVTQEGGNQTFKGAATVYVILTVPKRPSGDTHDPLKGDTHDPLHDTDRGDTSGEQGGHFGSEGGHFASDKGDTDDPPSGYSSGHIHHSARSLAAPLAPQVGASIGAILDENPFDFMAIEDALDEELGLDQQERNLVGGMLENGNHPNAIRNTINKQRADAVSVAVSQAKNA